MFLCGLFGERCGDGYGPCGVGLFLGAGEVGGGCDTSCDVPAADHTLVGDVVWCVLVCSLLSLGLRFD